MDITRASVLERDETVFVVKITGKDIRENPDAHALVDILDKLRVTGKMGNGLQQD